MRFLVVDDVEGRGVSSHNRDGKSKEGDVHVGLPLRGSSDPPRLRLPLGDLLQLGNIIILAGNDIRSCFYMDTEIMRRLD